jgi:hypothetical protein
MGRPLHLILLALYTNLGEAEAKLDAIAAARIGGGDTEPRWPYISALLIYSLTN